MRYRLIKWIVSLSVLFLVLVPNKIEAEVISWVPTQVEVVNHLKSYVYEEASQTKGEFNMLFFLIEFPETVHTQNKVDSQTAHELIFGDGSVSMLPPFYAEKPYESLTNFYNRASYGKLNITGSVYGWYQAEHDFAYYQTNGGLLEEVLSFYNSQIDYTQYDANDDGVLDGVVLHLHHGYGYERSFSTVFGSVPPNTDNMIVNRYTVMFDGLGRLSNSPKDYLPILIHETGHNLGTKDTYDRTAETSFDIGEGMQHSEVMNDNVWDFVSLHKIMFGWMENIQIIGPNDSRRITLNSFAKGDHVLMIFPYENNLDEFFLVEFITDHNNFFKLYQRSSNPLPGLRVFRVNLTEDLINANIEGRFKAIESVFTGSYIPYLDEVYENRINLMIEGDELSPNTYPSSYMYSRDPITEKASTKFSGVTINNIKVFGDDTVSFDVSTRFETELNTFNIELDVIGNYIDLKSNYELHPTYTSTPYLSDGTKSMMLNFEKNVWTADNFGLNTTRLVVNEDIYQYFDSDNLQLIIPAGTYMSSQGQLNELLSFNVQRAAFPQKINSIFESEDMRYDLGFYKLSETDIILFYVVAISYNHVEYFIDVFDRNGIKTTKKVELNLDHDNYEYYHDTSLVRLDNGNFALSLYNFTLKKYHLFLLSQNADVISTFDVPAKFDVGTSNDMIAFGNTVLMMPKDEAHYLGNWNIWQIDFVNEPIIHKNLPILGIDHDRSQADLFDKRSFFRIDEDRWIIDDSFSSYSFVIVDQNLNVLNEKIIEPYTGHERKTASLGFALDYRLLDNGNLMRIVCKWTYNRERDYFVQYFDSDLNFIYEKIIYQTETISDSTYDRLVSVQDGYLLSFIHAEMIGASNYSPYTKTLYLDKDLNVLSIYTDKISGQGVETTFISMEDYVFAGSRWQYGFSSDFIFPSSLNQINIVPNQISEHEIKLSFNKTYDKVDVYRSSNSRDGFEYVGTSNSNEFIDVVPTTESRHFYKAKAYKLIESEYVLESESSIVVGVSNGKAPQELSVFREKINVNQLSWQPQINVTGYEIYRKTYGYADYKLVAKTTESNFTDTLIHFKFSNAFELDDAEYVYKIRSYKVQGDNIIYSDFSKERRSGIPLLDLVYFSRYEVGNNQIKLYWEGESGVARIYRSTSEDGPYQLLTTTSNKSFTDLSAKNGIIYYYKLEVDVPLQYGTRTIKGQILTNALGPVIKGDLNSDGAVTTTDLVLLRRFLAGLINLDANAQAAADLDGNGSVTTTDLVKLRRQLAGLE